MREAFIVGFKNNVERFGVQGTLEIFPGGPPQILNMLVVYSRKANPQIAEWIEQNREDAERIAAGILGLM